MLIMMRRTYSLHQPAMDAPALLLSIGRYQVRKQEFLLSSLPYPGSRYRWRRVSRAVCTTSIT